MKDVPTGCVGKLFTKALSKNEHSEQYKRCVSRQFKHRNYYQKKQENKTVVSNLANNVR